MKYALVTGGSRGIGRAVCVRLARMGYHVLVNCVDRIDEAEHTLELVRQEGQDGEVLKFDVGNRVQVSAVLEAWMEKHPEEYIEVLVNNAGVLGASMPNATEEAFDKVIDTNLKGVFFLSQLFGGYLKANKVEGNILNVGSSSCLRPATSAYTLSKWGIRGLTLGLAKSLAPYGVTVNGIAPGPTATPMLLKDGQGNITNKGNPIGRYALPEEIANMAVVLVSPMGRTIVGDMVYMTGGAATVTYDDMDYTF